MIYTYVKNGAFCTILPESRFIYTYSKNLLTRSIYKKINLKWLLEQSQAKYRCDYMLTNCDTLLLNYRQCSCRLYVYMFTNCFHRNIQTNCTYIWFWMGWKLQLDHYQDFNVFPSTGYVSAQWVKFYNHWTDLVNRYFLYGIYPADCTILPEEHQHACSKSKGRYRSVTFDLQITSMVSESGHKKIDRKNRSKK